MRQSARFVAAVLLVLAAPVAVLAPRALAATARSTKPKAALGANAFPNDEAARAPPRPPVAVTDDGFLGIVVPRSAANVTAPLPGRVLSVNVRIGDRVRANDVLATLDASLVQADLNAARAASLSQEAEYEIARATRDAAASHELLAQQLAAEGLISGQDLLDRRKDHRLAKLRVDSLRASVAERTAQAERIQREVKLMVVRAPFDGMVVARYVDPGSATSAMALMPVVRLISERLFIRFAVPLSQATTLRPGVGIRAVTEHGTATLVGRVEGVAREVETSSHTAFAEASIDESTGEALSGAVVRVKLAASP